MGAKKGPKGKKGGGCAPGDVAICLDKQLWEQVKDAFVAGVESKGGTDSCVKGAIRVCLSRLEASLLVSAIVAATGTSGKKKKKKKGKGKKGK